MAWQSRPLFISSTFADMQAERDHLRTHVFPALEERLKAKRRHLEWVDLRLGVATAGQADPEARELQVLKVCLAEVRRCRPFLIVLLGDRYGWVPPAGRITAAAAEEGFGADVVGRSVTDLEIRFGVLADPEQQPRSYFYFREPLPYHDMPKDVAAFYADEYDAIPGSADRAKRLAELKQEIEHTLPDRVRRYSVGWDRRSQRVNGQDLVAWGRKVEKDIWSELEAATALDDADESRSWQQAERMALDDYIEDRARDFIGRDAVLTRLQMLAASAPQEGTAWGLILTGSAGTGKSAIFSELYRRLQRDGTFVLAHAAGASARSPSVEDMLRRWVEELAAALGTDPGLAENAGPETIEIAFRTLLGRVAAERRVVVLIDALDQFGATTRARFVTWLPRIWPANARLIATAIPGDASKTLTERAGVEVLDLRPLDAGEARRIAEGICARYHRTLELEVLDALVAKRGANGPPWGNPLWLVLAVEELNLVDADDFARAKRAYTGTPAEQLRALMLDIVAGLPADIIGLYGSTFDRAEELYGRDLAVAFLGLIALSRGGWRESDFRVLLPRLTGQPWDELWFASLRRLLRGQLRRFGGLGRWDFNHPEWQVAARQRLAAHGIAEAKVHAEIAKHLRVLPADDLLRQTESMFHLLASEDWAQASAYYGDPMLSWAEIDGATHTLATLLMGGRGDAALRLLNAVACPADAAEAKLAGTVAHRLLHDLDGTLHQHADLETRITLINGVGEILTRIDKLYPGNADWQSDLAVAISKVGDVLLRQLKLSEALETYRASLAIAHRLAKAGPDDAHRQHMILLSQNRIGGVLLEQGNLSEALDAFRASFAVANRWAKSEHHTASWERDLWVSQTNIADVMLQQGNLFTALEGYRAALAIVDRLAKADPGNTSTQDDLSVSHSKIGDVLRAQGNLPGTLEAYQTALAIADPLAKSDPSNAEWQWALSVCHENMGNILREQNDLPAALKCYEASLAIRGHLAKSDPRNADWQEGLSLSNGKVGDVLLKQGKNRGALEHYRAALAIRQKLAKSNSSNAKMQRDWGILQSYIGDVLRAQDDLPAALQSYQAAQEIAGDLAKAYPANSDWESDLASLHVKVGNVRRAQHELPAALQSYAAALKLRDRLTKADPDNVIWQRDLSISHDGIGDVLLEQGNLSGALDVYGEALAIRDHLAKADPDNANWQRGVSLSLEKIGSVLANQGELPAALESYCAAMEIADLLAEIDPSPESYRASLAIAKRLVRAEPSNAEWQHKLFMVQDRIGDMLLEEGNLSEALEAYRAALAIADPLAEADPSSALGQLISSTSRGKIGRVLFEQGELPAALESYQASRTIADGLAKANPDDDAFQRILSVSHDKVGDVLRAQGDLPAALRSYLAALAIAELLANTDPGDGHLQVALIQGRAALALAGLGERNDALRAFKRSRLIVARLCKAAPHDSQLVSELAWLDSQIAALER
jgi:tetratricopeptide (TPR) repeat protein